MKIHKSCIRRSFINRHNVDTYHENIFPIFIKLVVYRTNWPCPLKVTGGKQSCCIPLRFLCDTLRNFRADRRHSKLLLHPGHSNIPHRTELRSTPSLCSVPPVVHISLQFFWQSCSDSSRQWYVLLRKWATLVRRVYPHNSRCLHNWMLLRKG